MTFSIAARCSASGQLGLAVTSSSIAVAARCAFARTQVGAALTQNVTDPRLGPRMLDLLEDGLSCAEALQGVVGSTIHASHRQLALIDATGEAATFSGEHCLGINSTAKGQDCVSVGNLLDNREVPEAVVNHFADSSGPLAQRMIDALLAGLAAGGEAGQLQSAGLLLVDDVSWPVADLRVDWDDDPLNAINTLWARYEPQLQDYRIRGLNPDDAPSYGVPGDP